MLSASFFLSSNAAAELQRLPLQVNLNTVETLAPLTSSPERCALGTDAFSIGMTGGSGTVTITTGLSPKLVTIPVVLGASDCPTQKFSFSDGKFVLYAANGSILVATYFGAFGPTFAIVPSDSKFAIGGGTGFFSGASGSGTLGGGITIVSQAPFLGTGTLSGTGTISFSSSAFEKHFNIVRN